MKRGLLLSHHLRSSSISDSFYHKTTVLSLLFSLGGEIIMITNSKRQLENKRTSEASRCILDHCTMSLPGVLNQKLFRLFTTSTLPKAFTHQLIFYNLLSSRLFWLPSDVSFEGDGCDHCYGKSFLFLFHVKLSFPKYIFKCFF